MNPPTQGSQRRMQFGLFFFSSSESVMDADKYHLLIEGSKYADQHGFSSVWIPERHFTKEGGLFPNPAMLQAALSRETSRIQLRAGSVVMPLHDPIRVAEEWAVVDNLSGGRAGISFASGWHPSDFVFFPEKYSDRHEEMYRAIEIIQRLWRGESIERTGGDGKQVELRIYPVPVQPELPVWVTAAGSPQTFARAGAMGANLLTHLFNQGYEELAEKVALYRESLARHGHGAEAGRVTVAVPTFVHDNDDAISREAHSAFTDYIKSASYLLKAFAHNRDQRIDVDSLSKQELGEYVEWVCQRLILQKRILFGTPETCLEAVAELQAVGVDEIICQLDFGLNTEVVLESLPHLNRLRELAQREMLPNHSRVAAKGLDASPLVESLSSSRGTQSPEAQPAQPTREPITEILARCLEEIAGTSFYEILNRRGSEFASDSQALERLWRRDGEALGRVRLLKALEPEAGAYRIHPTLLDTCFQLLVAALPSSVNGDTGALNTSYLPVGLGSLQIHSRPLNEFWSHALLRSNGSTERLEGDVRLLDEEGDVIAEARGLRMESAELLKANWTELPARVASQQQPPESGRASSDAPQAEASSSALHATLMSAETEERERLLRLYICERLAAVLEMPVERIGVDQALNNLGLDSLMAIQLKNQIEKQLAVSVPVTTFLRGDSVAQLTEQLLGQLAAPSKATAPLAATEDVVEHPLSKGQSALWFMHQLSADGAAYNTVELAVRLRGEIDVPALRRSFQALVNRHPSLRTIYKVSEGKPVQVVMASQEAHFEALDAADWSEAQLNELMVKEYQRPFDLERGPLLRATLFDRSAHEHVLLLAAHHIAVDFLSMEIIIEELRVLYFADKARVEAQLRPLTMQYTDYARWQAEMLAGTEGQRLWAYWREQLSGKLPVLELPTDRPRPAGPSFRGAVHRFDLDAELTSRLRSLARTEAVTLNTTLLAAFFMLLHGYSGQEAILVGTPVAGRSRSEFEGIVGYFANPVVLRAEMYGNPTFREFLQQVNATALGALDHQDYPFALLIEQLQPVREANRAPLSDVLFHLDRPLVKGGVIGSMIGGPDEGELLMEPFITTEQRVARYDLVLIMLEGEDMISAGLQYKTDLFDAATVARMAQHFKALLGSILARPEASLKQLGAAGERQRRGPLTPEKPKGEPQSRGLRSAKRKTVDLSNVSLVKIGPLVTGQSLPLLIEPSVAHLDLSDWASGNRGLIEAKLMEHGALLFRGFNLKSLAEFERFTLASGNGANGDFVDWPTSRIRGKAAGSTSDQANFEARPLNESKRMRGWPLKMWLYCAQAAQSPQTIRETPLVDCRRVYQLMPAKIRTQFEKKRLMYTRSFKGGAKGGWQEFFGTTDRSLIEDYCGKMEMSFEWTKPDGLLVRQVCPAVARHPRTGEMVFAVRIQTDNANGMGPLICESLLPLYGTEALPVEVHYGDGSTVKESVIEEVREVYSRASVHFRWQEGDIILLDNLLSAIGSDPYASEPKLIVRVGEICGEASQTGFAMLENAVSDR